MKKSVVSVFSLAVVTALMGVPLHADAAFWGGTPDLGFKVDRPAGGFVDGDVYVHKLRVHHCDGSHQDYTINQWVDPVAGHSVQVQGGDLCSATWYWTNDVDIDGNGFSVTAWPDTTTVNLESIKPVEMLPHRYSGSAPYPWQPPELHTTIE